ncbi:PrgI family protein [Candidatus Peregrinibacteria bacterium]|nr:PrgI family protein [Candidatus Peregrinibacteria bacterium]
MQFKVPQDVQREDTIIGPLTLKQMITLGIGGGIAYAIYITLAKTYFMEVWLPPVAIVVVITLAFAFLKIHNMPFQLFIMNFAQYHILAKKRIWIQEADSPYISLLSFLEQKQQKKSEDSKKTKEKPTIAELTKVLDTHGEKHDKLQKLVEQNYKN